MIATSPQAEPGSRGISPRTLAALLLGLFAADNLILLRFLGLLPSLGVAGLIVAAGAAIWALCRAIPADLPRVPHASLAALFAVALAILVLGGEGRLLYANIDWQVRDAVLYDMASHPWPFAYDLFVSQVFLRAPLGMYLIPSLTGSGPAADIALLASNALRLSLVMALAWGLFDTRRQRLIVLAVFIVFSGWDIVGTAIYGALGEHPSWDHLESWNFGFQYSSHVTQAFWVPQHAVAGWACAVTFLLWRKRAAPIGLFAATIPLVAIWSPLAIMGAIPFALWAGFDVLRRRSFAACDIGLAALALAIALPSLVYLQTDAASVGGGLRPFPPVPFLFCATLEILPFAWLLLRGPRQAAVDRPLVWLTVALLLVMPFWQVGTGSDFQMRASIMPLALLAIAFADWLADLSMRRPIPRGMLAVAVLALAVGAVTPAFELRRALANGPSPRPLCSLVGVWQQQDNVVVPMSTYLAAVETLPFVLHPVTFIDPATDPATCWERRWVTIVPGKPPATPQAEPDIAL